MSNKKVKKQTRKKGFKPSNEILLYLKEETFEKIKDMKDYKSYHINSYRGLYSYMIGVGFGLCIGRVLDREDYHKFRDWLDDVCTKFYYNKKNKGTFWKPKIKKIKQERWRNWNE